MLMMIIPVIFIATLDIVILAMYVTGMFELNKKMINKLERDYEDLKSSHEKLKKDFKTLTDLL